ncbi:MAG: NAD(P)H-binding protein [Chloroflexota bacterium]
MSTKPFDVVTGAFGYTGRYIARTLLERHRTVRTLTHHPERSSLFGGAVTAHPLDFERDRLAEALQGADVLYNTYWVRFNRGAVTFDRAVQQCGALFDAAAEVGVRRIVHISVTNADPASLLPYFRGKGQVEAALRACGLPYTILRPALVFGPEDLLLNNIAWCLRLLPVVGLPGSGDYPIHPVFAGDLGTLAADAGNESGCSEIDAVGPEVYSYRSLVLQIAAAAGSHAKVISVPPWLALAACGLLGMVNRDVMLTADEMAGLTRGLLVSHDPPRGTTRFSDWVRANGATLGRSYRSELAAHYAGPAG